MVLTTMLKMVILIKAVTIVISSLTAVTSLRNYSPVRGNIQCIRPTDTNLNLTLQKNNIKETNYNRLGVSDLGRILTGILSGFTAVGNEILSLANVEALLKKVKYD